MKLELFIGNAVASRLFTLRQKNQHFNVSQKTRHEKEIILVEYLAQRSMWGGWKSIGNEEVKRKEEEIT